MANDTTNPNSLRSRIERTIRAIEDGSMDADAIERLRRALGRALASAFAPADQEPMISPAVASGAAMSAAREAGIAMARRAAQTMVGAPEGEEFTFAQRREVDATVARLGFACEPHAAEVVATATAEWRALDSKGFTTLTLGRYVELSLAKWAASTTCG